MVNCERLISLLKEIAQLLERNGHSGQAGYVSALAVVAEWDSTAVAPGLASGAMWGGAGSVFDVGKFDSRDDRRRFMQMLVQLVNEMRQAGISAPGADQAAAIMSGWLETEVI